MQARILLVEDEPGLVMTLGDRLRAENYAVESAQDGETGLERALNEPFDLVILDWMLPRKNGLDVCREIRQNGMTVPILMLTARGQVVDKVLGLQLGADDYVTKPFEMMELLARIQALLRRVAVRPAAAAACEFGDVKIDFKRMEVRRAGDIVPLSALEFRLLQYLIEHQGETLSREQLLKEVWGYQSTATRTVDVHMTWLRQKLEEHPKFPRHFATVRGVGYRFDPA